MLRGRPTDYPRATISHQSDGSESHALAFVRLSMLPFCVSRYLRFDRGSKRGEKIVLRGLERGAKLG
jgi:hypothetical protein